MSQKQYINILIFFFLFILGVCGLYKFMTSDRNYTWAKEYKEKIILVGEENGFRLNQTTRIEVSTIERSTKKVIEIRIRMVLSAIHIMLGGEEYGESIVLKSESTDGYLNCKGWCVGDHLIGLEIAYSNIDSDTLKKLKSEMERQFYTYEIIWTER